MYCYIHTRIRGIARNFKKEYKKGSVEQPSDANEPYKYVRSSGDTYILNGCNVRMSGRAQNNGLSQITHFGTGI